MDLQKVNVKFFVENGSGVPLDVFIHVFNSWIQASDGEYYDVADYSHVPAGPGIVLIAHEANTSIDETGNRRGLLYNRKAPLEGTNRERLLLVVERALDNCRRLEKESSLKGRLKFRGSEALLMINDRLLAPNTPETFQAVKPDLEKLARELYGGVDFTLEYQTDPRQRFAVRLRAGGEFEVEALLRNIEGVGTNPSCGSQV